jgi:predicted ATPase
MLTKLELQQFKNFEKTRLILGPLTLLIGTNASGKSNIRDAFRFLHGISRGYNLAETMGEKYVEGGVLQWRGIRGGTREITFLNADTFALTVELDIKIIGSFESRTPKATYSIQVEPDAGGGSPRVVKESLYVEERLIFDSHPPREPPRQQDAKHIVVRIALEDHQDKRFAADQPVLTQISGIILERRASSGLPEIIPATRGTIEALSSMRFLDPSLDAMRLPSFPGQTILGDRGENLSSVLQAICQNPQQRKALVEWIQELTPMDASDLDFVPDQTGKILVTLIEKDGRRTSIYSASGGTLRFLAMIAALLGPKPAQLYFFEELENSLHPARLHLLLQLIEQKTAARDVQIVASTHSPQLLRFLSAKARKYASLVYRLPHKPSGHTRRILDIPNTQEIIAQQDLARLHESGWFEDAMAFLEETRENQ